MSEMRDGLETAEQAIYESLGLALPGAVALAVGFCILAPDALGVALAFATNHRWLALGACYLAGYPVQSLSRPVDKLMTCVPRAALWGLRRLNARWADRVSAAWVQMGKWLQRGHKPEPERQPSEDPRERINLVDLEHAHWHARFGLDENQRLEPFDVKNLSFSTLGADQRRLHRFRAITSLSRAMAAISGATFCVAVYLDARWGHWNLAGLAAAAACGVVFVAFRERANMYDGLWNAIIGPQFLASNARSASAGAPITTPASTSTLSLSSGIANGITATSPPHQANMDANGSVPRLDKGDLRA